MEGGGGEAFSGMPWTLLDHDLSSVTLLSIVSSVGGFLYSLYKLFSHTISYIEDTYRQSTAELVALECANCP